MKLYKIMDTDSKGQLKVLFHGINKSKVMPLNEWIQADIKMARDGSGKKWYRCGFHCLGTIQECYDYLKRFKNTSSKVIVECTAGGEIWMKPDTGKHEVYLTEWLKFDRVVEQVASEAA